MKRIAIKIVCNWDEISAWRLDITAITAFETNRGDGQKYVGIIATLRVLEY